MNSIFKFQNSKFKFKILSAPELEFKIQNLTPELELEFKIQNLTPELNFKIQNSKSHSGAGI